MLCSSIIFFSNNDIVCEIDDNKYHNLNESELLIFVTTVAKEKGADHAILRAFHHNQHHGKDSMLWSAV